MSLRRYCLRYFLFETTLSSFNANDKIFALTNPHESFLQRLCFATEQVNDRTRCGSFKYKIVIYLDLSKLINEPEPI